MNFLSKIISRPSGATDEQPNLKQAHTGTKLQAYYDDKLKRWVFPGEDTTAPTQAVAPPPMMASGPLAGASAAGPKRFSGSSGRSSLYTDPFAELQGVTPIRHAATEPASASSKQRLSTTDLFPTPGTSFPVNDTWQEEPVPVASTFSEQATELYQQAPLGDEAGQDWVQPSAFGGETNSHYDYPNHVDGDLVDGGNLESSNGYHQPEYQQYYHQVTYQTETYQEDTNPPEAYQPEYYQQEVYQQDTHQPELYQPESYHQESYQQNTYLQDTYLQDPYQPETQESDQRHTYQEDSRPPEIYQEETYQQEGYNSETYQHESGHQDATYQEEVYQQGTFEAYQGEPCEEERYQQDQQEAYHEQVQGEYQPEYETLIPSYEPELEPEIEPENHPSYQPMTEVSYQLSYETATNQASYVGELSRIDVVGQTNDDFDQTESGLKEEAAQTADDFDGTSRVSSPEAAEISILGHPLPEGPLTFPAHGRRHDDSADGADSSSIQGKLARLVAASAPSEVRAVLEECDRRVGDIVSSAMCRSLFCEAVESVSFAPGPGREISRELAAPILIRCMEESLECASAAFGALWNFSLDGGFEKSGHVIALATSALNMCPTDMQVRRNCAGLLVNMVADELSSSSGACIERLLNDRECLDELIESALKDTRSKGSSSSELLEHVCQILVLIAKARRDFKMPLKLCYAVADAGSASKHPSTVFWAKQLKNVMRNS